MIGGGLGQTTPDYSVGIKPLKPGFGELEIAPVMGSIEKLTITTQTVKSSIHLSLQQSKNKLIAVVDLPPSVTGVLKWWDTAFKLTSGKQKIVV